MNRVLFHLAFPVGNIATTKEFYVGGLGCTVGRESHRSVILNLYDHQIVAHISNESLEPQKGIYPRHFGLVFLSESDWEALADRAYKHNLTFYQEPKNRFRGLPIEHRTFFLQDPFYNLLEFKFYYDREAIFGDRQYAQVGDIG